MIADCTAVILVGGGSRRIGVDNAALLLSFRFIWYWNRPMTKNGGIPAQMSLMEVSFNEK